MFALPVPRTAAALAVALPFVLALASPGLAAAPTNLIVNGTFDSSLAGWSAPGPGCTTASWIGPGSGVYSDNGFAPLDGGAAWLNACIDDRDTSLVQILTVIPGTTYRIAGLVRPGYDAPAAPAGRFDSFGVRIDGVATAVTYGATATRGWTPFSLTFTATAASVTLTLLGQRTGDHDYLVDGLTAPTVVVQAGSGSGAYGVVPPSIGHDASSDGTTPFAGTWIPAGPACAVYTDGTYTSLVDASTGAGTYPTHCAGPTSGSDGSGSYLATIFDGSYTVDPVATTVSPDPSTGGYTIGVTIPLGARIAPVIGSGTCDTTGAAAPTYALDRDPTGGSTVPYPVTGAMDTTGWLPGSYRLTVTYPGDGNCLASSDGSRVLALAAASLPPGGSSPAPSATAMPGATQDPGPTLPEPGLPETDLRLGKAGPTPALTPVDRLASVLAILLGIVLIGLGVRRTVARDR